MQVSPSNVHKSIKSPYFQNKISQGKSKFLSKFKQKEIHGWLMMQIL